MDQIVDDGKGGKPLVQAEVLPSTGDILLLSRHDSGRETSLAESFQSTGR